MAGMHVFVKDRNADVRTGSPLPDLSDLKPAVPTAKGDKKRKSKQSTSARRENDSSVRQHRPHSTSTRSSASGVDDISTTASTSRQRTGKDHLETRPNSYDNNVFKNEGPPVNFDDVHNSEAFDFEEGGDVPRDTGDPDEELRFANLLAQAHGKSGSPTIAQTHIKGDSYPSTSVGPPSINEHDQYEARTSGEVANMPNHAERGNVRSQPYKQAPQPRRVYASHTLSKTAAPSHQPQAQQPMIREPKSDFDFSAGFAFGPPPPVKKEIAVHTSHPQNQAVEQRPQVAEIKATATRSRIEPEMRSNRQVAPSMSAPFERQHMPSHRPERFAEAHDYGDRHRGPVTQHNVTDQGPRSDPATDEDPGEQLEQPEQEIYQEDALDYDLSELYDKDYQSLKAEPFDHRPGAQPFEVPDLPDSASVADRVAHLARMNQDTQAQFFASLNIDEWEEAGDWFLDRFGDTIKKLKDVRREKRKAARAFEDEIKQREAAISKKRDLTRAAMDGMKSSGAAVLLGTPGKKK